MTGRQPGLLCVYAHPDDESMSTGGVLARYADEGLRTAVVTCTAVDVLPWLDRKWSAPQAHATQVGPSSLLAFLPEDLRAEVLGTEWFIHVGATPTDTAVSLEDDLFAGIR